MGGEYSFLEGMSKAANPYLQGAMQEGWRRKREDKATEAAVKSTEESRRFQLNSVLAGTGSAKEGAFADSPYSKELGEINKYKKDIAEREQAQEKIDEARKTVDHKNKQLGLLSTATKDLQKTIKDPNIPNDLKLANINAMYGQYRELGYNMPDWETSDLLNYQEKIKSDNNTIISTITGKVGKFSKEIFEMPKGTPQKGMMVNARANFLLEEIAVLKAGTTDKATLAVLALKESAIKKSVKDFETKNTKETDRQKRLADAKATENRALENKKKMETWKQKNVPTKPTGELTEASVLRALDNQSVMSDEKLATMTKRYVKEKKRLRKENKGLSDGQIRFEALNIVLEGVGPRDNSHFWGEYSGQEGKK